MEISLRDIVFVGSRLNQDNKSLVDKLCDLRPVPTAKASYWFGKMRRLFTEELKTLDESRNELIKEIGIEDEDGRVYIPSDDTERVKRFAEEFEALLNETIDLPIRSINLSDIGDCPIPIELMEAFSFMIEDGEEPE